MNNYSFGHLANHSVLCEYDAIEARENADTATALALLGEIDARRLFVPAGYPSMYAYCLQARHMSEDRACKRIKVARAARKFPAIYDAISAGRVHLTALYLLEPHMTAASVDRLLAAATHKTKAQIALLLAELAPKEDVPASIQPLQAAADNLLTVPAEQCEAQPARACEVPPALGRVGSIVAQQIATSTEPLPGPRPKVTPLSPQRFGVRFTVDQATHDMLRDVQALLDPSVPSGDIAKVFALALECLKSKLEQQKCGKRARPGKRRGSKNARYIPDDIKNAVWDRDGGQCTFVGAGGKRCDAKATLEYYHVQPVARGGRATVAGVRLLCRAHNQFEAERVMGAEFMAGKRRQAQERAQARAAVDAPDSGESGTGAYS
jgi:hypothetical protein